MRALLLAGALLGGCSVPSPGSGISFVIAGSFPPYYQAQAGLAVSYMAAAWTGLGGVVSAESQQSVTLSYGGGGDGNQNGLMAWTDYASWTVTFFDLAFSLANQDLWRVLSMHEFGHILGAAHTACDFGAVMSPDPRCYPTGQLVRYDPSDLQQFCNSGYLSACSSRSTQVVIDQTSGVQ